MNAAEGLFFAVQVWLICGAVLAAVFLTVGIDRIDEDARGAYVFRPLLIPGILLIWPLVAWRWWVLETGRDVPLARHAPPRAVHGVIAIGISVAMALIITLGLSQRQSWPADFVPQRLTDPSGASQ